MAVPGRVRGHGSPRRTPPGVFIGRDSVLPRRTLAGSGAERAEVAQLDMMYRTHVESAVGHGTAVHTDALPDDPTRAHRIATRSVPCYEVPRTDPPNADEPGFGALGDTVFDMRTLSLAIDAELPGMVAPLSVGYRDWLGVQAQRLAREPDLADHADTASDALVDAGRIADRLDTAIALLANDTDTRNAFRFANRAMWQQRVRTLAAAGQR